MEKLTWNELSIENKFLMAGHSLIVFGGDLLAFGNLLKLLKGDGLPSVPMLETSGGKEEPSLYGKRRSYFES